jgi:hypothetical protein
LVTDWFFAFPQIHVEILTSIIMVLGGGAFGGDYFMGAELFKVELCPYQRGPERPFLSSLQQENGGL